MSVLQQSPPLRRDSMIGQQVQLWQRLSRSAAAVQLDLCYQRLQHCDRLAQHVESGRANSHAHISLTFLAPLIGAALFLSTFILPKSLPLPGMLTMFRPPSLTSGSSSCSSNGLTGVEVKAALGLCVSCKSWWSQLDTLHIDAN